MQKTIRRIMCIILIILLMSVSFASISYAKESDSEVDSEFSSETIEEDNRIEEEIQAEEESQAEEEIQAEEESRAEEEIQAEEGQVEEEIQTEEDNQTEEDVDIVLGLCEEIKVETESVDVELLLEDYIDRSITNDLRPAYRASSMAGDNLTGLNKIIYEKAKSQISQVAKGNADLVDIIVDPAELGIKSEGYTAEELGVSALLDKNGQISSEATDALAAKVGIGEFEPTDIFTAIRRDCPYEQYWMDNGYSYRQIMYFYCSSTKKLQLILPEEAIFSLKPNADFAGMDPNRVDTAKTKAVATTISGVKGILDTASGYSDIEKVRYYKDWICNNTDYDYNAATDKKVPYGNPWQLIWVFDDNPNTKVVCEGYCKAFMYLCDKTVFADSSVNCYIATGNAVTNDSSGLHMWNILHWSDNVNYHVDITFCDTSNTDYFFMQSPKSGDPQNGYYYSDANTYVNYYYDEYTKSVFTEQQLTLGIGREELSDFHINYDSNVRKGDTVRFTLIREGGSDQFRYRLKTFSLNGKAVSGYSKYSVYGNNHVFDLCFDSFGTYCLEFSIQDSDGKEISKKITVNTEIKSGNGIVQQDDGNWYYMSGDKVLWDYTGFVSQDGKQYYIQEGMLVKGELLVKNNDGTLCYVKDGVLYTSFSGIYDYNGESYYIQNGVVAKDKNGPAQIGNAVYYLTNGKVDNKYTGLVQYNNKWYYIQNGRQNKNYTGLCYYDGKYYYIQSGELIFGVNGLTDIGGSWYNLENSAVKTNYTGLVYYSANNGWFYVQKGELKWGVNTLVQYNGIWYYVKNSRVDWGFTGVFEYGGTKYYIQKGQINWGVNGLTNAGGTWYYLENSAVKTNYTGLVYYSGNKKWFYVQKGELKWGVRTLVQYCGTWYYVNNSALDWNYTGVFEYGGTKYYIQKGQINWGVNGLTNASGKWYYLENSAVKANYTGLVYYSANKKWFYVQKGELIWGANTLVEYYGTWYYVNNSTLDWNYTGLFEYKGTKYYIQSGRIVWGIDGLTRIGNDWYYLKNSALRSGYTGLVEYNKNLYYVQKGVLIWGYNGTASYDGKMYTVRNSMAVK